ncbi:rhomboid family intramembrane serine protease [Novipirellula caenicola]|uniref:Peptidase S54 rhomboid domain-containing protein n=1 Tax=Novipirellula caenicola TaxID=1536901 RepID=A0ABP9VLL0_9BACT
MIPLRDSIPSRTIPVINYLIIVLCTASFMAQLVSEGRGGRIAERYGMVPARLSNADVDPVISERVGIQTPFGIEVRTITRELAPSPIPAWMTLLTCMFLHGGWMHFLGNMWFLYIFGDNVEDRLGHFGYALMYLGTGIAASLSHFITDPASPMPTIGASGAIAGVMGAYAWLYPHAKVQALIPLIIIFYVIVVPAPLFLGIWFALQTYSGISAVAGGAATGVAWWAHIGGFAAGALSAVAIGRTPLGHEAVTERRF